MCKQNQIKLKPGLGAFYAIKPVNEYTDTAYSTVPGAHMGQHYKLLLP